MHQKVITYNHMYLCHMGEADLRFIIKSAMLQNENFLSHTWECSGLIPDSGPFRSRFIIKCLNRVQRVTLLMCIVLRLYSVKTLKEQ